LSVAVRKKYNLVSQFMHMCLQLQITIASLIYLSCSQIHAYVKRLSEEVGRIFNKFRAVLLANHSELYTMN